MRFLRPCRAVVLVLGASIGGGIALASPPAPAPPASSQLPESTAQPSPQLPAREPAVWIQHDIVVHLEDLPRRYSCDDLWYKFRDVLLALGARQNMRILAYRCESALGAIARSPSVHLQFELPQAVQGGDVRWADMQANPRTVRLGPGSPASLDASDCELLRQIKSGLLPALSDHVVAYHLACQAAPAARHPFSLSVQALVPASTGDSRLASSSQPVPRLSEPTAPAAAHVTDSSGTRSAARN